MGQATDIAARSSRARPWAWAMLAAAAAVICAGAYFRLHRLGDPGLWLDEILGVRGVGPEHGPVYYWMLQLAQTIENTEVGIRLPFALAGIAALVSCLGATGGSLQTGTIAAALLAFSPIHIFYSRDARPYALLVCWTFLGLVAIFRLHRTRRWSWHAPAIATVALLLLTSANGVFYAAGLLLVYAAAHYQKEHRIRWIAAMVALAAAVIGFFRVQYGGLAGSVAFTIDPAIIGGQVPQLAQALVSGHNERASVNPILYGYVVLAFVGAIALIRRDVRIGAAMMAAAALGLVLPVVVIAGHGHWISARYTLSALPFLIVLVANGISAPVQWAVESVMSNSRIRRAAEATIAIAIVTAVLQLQHSAIISGLRDKADWRRVARVVAELARPGDLVVASNQWSEICLDYYFQRLRATLEVRNADESIDRARALLANRDVAFLVTGGFHTNNAIRAWMGGFHTLHESRIETIGVHFYPDRTAFLTARLAPAQLRRDAEAFWRTEGHIGFGREMDKFLLEGWSDPEQDRAGRPFRWAVGRQSSLYVPLTRAAPIQMELSLMPYLPIADRQVVRVEINGVHVADHSLRGGWNDVIIDVSAAPWRAGGNILRFQFSDAISPAAFGAGDSRVLAAAFKSLVLRMP